MKNLVTNNEFYELIPRKKNAFIQKHLNSI